MEVDEKAEREKAVIKHSIAVGKANKRRQRRGLFELRLMQTSPIKPRGLKARLLGSVWGKV